VYFGFSLDIFSCLLMLHIFKDMLRLLLPNLACMCIYLLYFFLRLDCSLVNVFLLSVLCFVNCFHFEVMCLCFGVIGFVRFVEFWCCVPPFKVAIFKKH